MTGRYADSRYARELAEQPEALARVVHSEETESNEAARRLAASDVEWVLVAARGSSDNAARYAQYLFGVRHGLPVALATPSVLTRYGARLDLGRAAVIGISQSGASPDITAVLDAAREQNRPAVALTNDPVSPLATAAEAVVPLRAGEEGSVAATKTYTNAIGALARVSAALSGEPGDGAELAAMPRRLGEVIAHTDAVAAAASESFSGAATLVTVGRGFGYGSAFEVALKVEELAGVIAKPFSSADIRHGPVAALTEQVPVILLAPRGQVFADLVDVADRVRHAGCPLMVVSDDAELRRRGEGSCELPTGVPEWLAPLILAVPGQQLAGHLAARRGHDIDRPAGLSKITETH